MSLFAGLFNNAEPTDGKKAKGTSSQPSGGLFAASSAYKSEVQPVSAAPATSIAAEPLKEHSAQAAAEPAKKRARDSSAQQAPVDAGKKRKHEQSISNGADASMPAGKKVKQQAEAGKGREAKQQDSRTKHQQQDEEQQGSGKDPSKVKKQGGPDHKQQDSQQPAKKAKPSQDSTDGTQQVPPVSKQKRSKTAPEGEPKHGKAEKQGKQAKQQQQQQQQEEEQDEDQDQGQDDTEGLVASQGAEEGDTDGAEDDKAEAGAEEGKEDGKRKLTPEEMAERNQRTVFVGNVLANTSRKTLKKLFEKYGKVDSVRLRSLPVDLDAKMPRKAKLMLGKVDSERAPAVAYVVFEDEASVAAALEANMTQLEGNHLRVDRAAAPSKSGKAAPGSQGSMAQRGGTEFDPSRSLFCGNLHFATTDEELIQFFTSPEALEGNPELAPEVHGGKPALEAVRVVRDPGTAMGKGFAFALFRTKAAARAALSLAGKELRKRAIRITRMSVQQQKKVAMQRTAAATTAAAVRGGGSSSRGRGGAARGGMAGRGGSGGAGGTGSTRGAPAGRGGRGGLGGGRIGSRGGSIAAAPDPATWAGTRVKGKGKGIKGVKAMQGSQGGFKPSTGAGQQGQVNKGKRPSVAARKQKMKQQGKKGSKK